jgi:steroid delta-isomerase-like uncharacterized protein
MADRTETEALVARFFSSLAVRDIAGTMDCLSEDIIHDTPYGKREIGWEPFERYIIHRMRCYRTEYDGLVILSDSSGLRAAAEFVLKAEYIDDDELLGSDGPSASGQRVSLQAGMFFEVDENRITRLSAAFDRITILEQLAG